MAFHVRRFNTSYISVPNLQIDDSKFFCHATVQIWRLKKYEFAVLLLKLTLIVSLNCVGLRFLGTGGLLLNCYGVKFKLLPMILPTRMPLCDGLDVMNKWSQCARREFNNGLATIFF